CSRLLPRTGLPKPIPDYQPLAIGTKLDKIRCVRVLNLFNLLLPADVEYLDDPQRITPGRAGNPLTIGTERNVGNVRMRTTKQDLDRIAFQIKYDGLSV